MVIPRATNFLLTPLRQKLQHVYRNTKEWIFKSEDLPRDVRRIEISDPENLRPEDVEAMLADANALAERLGRVHRMPKFWLASDATITMRDDAEDFAETAGDLARDLCAFVAAVETSPINGLFEGSALTVDFEVLSTFLKAIIRDRGICDVSLVEAFLRPDNLAIAEHFCEAKRDLTIAETHLEKCLSLTGAEVDEKLSTVRALSLENNNCISPDKISQQISEDEDLLFQSRREIQIVSDLPAEWAETSGMTVKALQRAARRIMSFDDAVLSLRLADPGCQAAVLSHELKTTIATLAAELRQIQETLPLADNQYHPSSSSYPMLVLEGFYAALYPFRPLSKVVVDLTPLRSLKDQAFDDPTTTTDQHSKMLICGSCFAQKLRYSVNIQGTPSFLV
jgi:hypothetical protein